MLFELKNEHSFEFWADLYINEGKKVNTFAVLLRSIQLKSDRSGADVASLKILASITTPAIISYTFIDIEYRAIRKP